MHVNNEIGTVQPVDRLADLAREHEAYSLRLCPELWTCSYPEGPDMIAVSAHKIHGPKGIGALVDTRRARVDGAYSWWRTGAGLSFRDIVARALRLGWVWQQSWRLSAWMPIGNMSLCSPISPAKKFSAWTINGTIDHRYPGNLNIRRDGLDVARLMSDVRGVAFSAGSACASGSGRPSHVLPHSGWKGIKSSHRFRLGFGRYTTQEEIVTAAGLIKSGSGEAAIMSDVTVHFVSPNGSKTVTAKAAEGDCLLTVAQIHDQPLEGTCEGQMACSTCHVIVDAEDFESCPEPVK